MRKPLAIALALATVVMLALCGGVVAIIYVVRSSTTVDLNEAVTVDKFEVRVKSVDCGATTYRGEVDIAQAHGTYCAMTLAVKNISHGPGSWTDTSSAYVGEDYYYSDASASLYANRSKDAFPLLQAGEEATGIIVFDIPAGRKLTSIHVQNASLDNGATVKL